MTVAHRDVVVEGNRIAAVRPTTGTADGPRYVMPGVWDMQVHVCPHPERPFFPLCVALGITGIRDMSRSMDSIRTWRDDIATGQMAGPRLIGWGSIVDGPNPRRPSREDTRPDRSGARDMVARLKAAGADFVKIYPALPYAAYLELIAAAGRNDLTVCGHVPVEVGVADASEAGQRSMEHLDGFLLASSSEEDTLRPMLREATASITQPMPDSFYPEETADAHLARLAEALAGLERSGFAQATREVVGRALKTLSVARTRQLLERFVRNQTWQCPTLYVHHIGGQATVFDSDAADARLLARSLRRPARPRPGSERVTAAYRDIVRQASAAGVPLLAGTDVGPYPNMIPAVALHDELRLLVRSGLTPVEALAAATSEPARFLNLSDDLGQVAEGKLADLLVLDANPFEAIEHTRRI